jgi:hypothetical protein
MGIIREFATIEAEALFDESKIYRYSLKRRWDKEKPNVTYILLNPSKADHLKNDDTFSFCMNYATDSGYGQLEIVNLFAYRCTNSDELKSASLPIVGPLNDYYILESLEGADLIVAGWGSKGSLRNRDNEVKKLLKGHNVLCFSDSRNLQLPRHPGRLKSDFELIEFLV